MILYFKMELYEQSKTRTATLSFLLFPSGIFYLLINRKSREMGEKAMIILESLKLQSKFSILELFELFSFFLR